MIKQQFKFTIITLLSVIAFMFMSCEKSSLLEPENSAVQSQPRFLKFRNGGTALFRNLHSSQLVTAEDGGLLTLDMGDPAGAMTNHMYGVSDNYPYNIYEIDAADPENITVVGQLAFRSRAIALHPITGKLFYVGKDMANGIYPVGVWDPANGSNSVLADGSNFRPAEKLAFDPDGTLYGISTDYPGQLFSINTTTGAWELVQTFSTDLINKGDMAFSPSGEFYNVSDKELYQIDLANGRMFNIGNMGIDKVTGLFFDRNGQAYVARNNGNLYTLDLDRGNATFISGTGINKLHDLAPVIAYDELAYAHVTLNILPGGLSEDTDISLSMETTEIMGGVHITFNPHGTIFTQPAILNVEVLGADLSGVDPNAIDIYYENAETNTWELMQRDRVIVDANTGYIQVINAELPHFSRYALASD